MTNTDTDLLRAGAKTNRLARSRADAAQERDKLITAAVLSGRSQSEVARLAGVTRMRVSQLMAEYREREEA
jgi:DNA-directed RNA polymerase specialized sigma subunit